MKQKKYLGWTLKDLLDLRKQYSQTGQVGNLMSTNALLEGWAKKNKQDYYSLTTDK